MKKLLTTIALVLAAGCLSPTASYTSGTHLTIGLWVPLADGQTFGLQFCDWLSGSKLVAGTNGVLAVQHQTSCTNSYFGVVRTNESIYDIGKTAVGAAAQPLALEVMKPAGNQFDGWTTDSTLHTNDIKKVIR